MCRGSRGRCHRGATRQLARFPPGPARQDRRGAPDGWPPWRPDGTLLPCARPDFRRPVRLRFRFRFDIDRDRLNRRERLRLNGGGGGADGRRVFVAGGEVLWHALKDAQPVHGYPLLGRPLQLECQVLVADSVAGSVGEIECELAVLAFEHVHLPGGPHRHFGAIEVDLAGAACDEFAQAVCQLAFHAHVALLALRRTPFASAVSRPTGASRLLRLTPSLRLLPRCMRLVRKRNRSLHRPHRAAGTGC